MAVVFNCGFECGSTLDNKWTVSSAATTIQTGTVRTGSYALRTNAAAAASYAQHFLQAAQTTSVLRFYARWAALPNTATDTRFLLGIVSAGTQPQLMTDSGGVVTFGFNGATQVVHGSTVTTGTWYRFDVRVLNNDGTGTKKMDVQVNGVTATQATLSEAGSNVTAWRIGNPTSAITSDTFIDDVIIGDATGDYPFGAGQSTAVVPTGDGTHSFTAGDFGDNAGVVLSSATTLWQKVDDSPMPLAGAALTAADWLEQIVNRTTGYLEFTHDFSSITNDPRAITANVAVQAETAASAAFEVRLNDNGTVETGSTIPATVAVTTIRHAFKTRATRPSTSTAWTVASLSTLRTRWGYSGDAAPDVRLEALNLEIDFNPNITCTPTTLALSDTTFAPTVTLSDNQLVTPTTATLTSAKFAPVLKEVVTPLTSEQTLLAHIPDVTLAPALILVPIPAYIEIGVWNPTVTVSDNQLVTPSTASLSSGTFAPTIGLSDHQTVTPTTKAASLTTFAPVLKETLTATTASLSTSTFAPTVTASDHQSVTPTTRALTLATFAPSVSVTAGNDIVVPNASLTLSTFAPTVSATAHQTLTPDTSSLTVTAFAPIVTASDHQSVTPTTKALTTARFAPTVSATAHQTLVPASRALTLATFTPTVRLKVVPDATSLTLGTFAPTVTATTNAYAFPPSTPLVLTRYAPTIAISAHKLVTPATAALVLTAYAPTAEQHSITPLPDLIYGYEVIAMGSGAGIEVAETGATVRMSENGSSTVSTNGPSARVTIR